MTSASGTNVGYDGSGKIVSGSSSRGGQAGGRAAAATTIISVRVVRLSLSSHSLKAPRSQPFDAGGEDNVVGELRADVLRGVREAEVLSGTLAVGTWAKMPFATRASRSAPFVAHDGTARTAALILLDKALDSILAQLRWWTFNLGFVGRLALTAGTAG